MTGRADAVHGVSLLFPSHMRPDRTAIRAFVEESTRIRISFDPASRPPYLRVVGEETRDREYHAHENCMELLREGLTFDCCLPEEDANTSQEAVKHRFDVDDALVEEGLSALVLTPGVHLTGGGRSMPVVRGLFALARDFIQHFEAAQVIWWSPARALIGRRFFESTVSAWLEGGPFPALGLTAFETQPDGSLASAGLTYFIEQEIRIEPELAADQLHATRLGIRLVNQLVLLGGIEQPERIIGPDGSRLVLKPSRNGTFVRVSKE